MTNRGRVSASAESAIDEGFEVDGGEGVEHFPEHDGDMSRSIIPIVLGENILVELSIRPRSPLH